MRSQQTDIRLNHKNSLKWQGSIFLYAITFFVWIVQFISPIMVSGKIIKIFSKKQIVFPFIITEIWLFIILIIEIIGIIFWNNSSILLRNIFMIFAIYALVDSLSATLRDVTLAPNIHDGYVVVYNRQRWLFLGLIAIFEIILGFSIMFLYFGKHFNTAISDSFTAVYFSTITFITYGDNTIGPKDNLAKILVLSELLFFFIFLSIKLPTAVSMIKIKSKEDKPDIA